MYSEIEKEVAPQKLSLKDFIEDYQKTLASIGVLIVLGIFWKNIYAVENTPYVSYLCFLATLPLLFEIVRAYDFNASSWNLRAFLIIMCGIFFYSASYILTNFLDHTITIAMGATWWALLLLLAKGIDQLGNYLKTRSYNEAVDYAAQIHSREDLTQDIRNQIVTLRNETLSSFNKLVNSFQTVSLVILAIAITFLLILPLDRFLHAVIDGTNINDVPAVRVD